MTIEGYVLFGLALISSVSTLVMSLVYFIREKQK